MVGMALILQSLADSGRPLSHSYATLPRYSMVKRSLPLPRPVSDAELAELAQAEFGGPIDTSDGVKVTLPEGWVHLRRSNTEPIVRAIAESRDPQAATALVERALRRFGTLMTAAARG
jgi:phosphomannomutase